MQGGGDGESQRRRSFLGLANDKGETNELIQYGWILTGNSETNVTAYL